MVKALLSEDCIMVIAPHQYCHHAARSRDNNYTDTMTRNRAGKMEELWKSTVQGVTLPLAHEKPAEPHRSAMDDLMN